jgi:pantetheine-phosphate adenylyltransferase
LRAVSDFEFEFQMALINRKLSPEFETFFMVPGLNYTFLNSSVIKEIYSFGGRAPDLVPPIVEKHLIKRFKK